MTSVNGADGFSKVDISGFKNLRPLREINSNQPVSLKTGSNTVEKDLEKKLAKSPLDERIPNKATLKKMGFQSENSDIIDMNGGTYYGNGKGATIRIAGWHGQKISGPENSTCVYYKSEDNKTEHEVVYDPEGNPMKGILTVKNEDGSIETFEFEYDLDGNKKITSYQKMVRG